MRYNLLKNIICVFHSSDLIPVCFLRYLNGFMQFSCIGFEVVGVFQTCIFFSILIIHAFL